MTNNNMIARQTNLRLTYFRKAAQRIHSGSFFCCIALSCCGSGSTNESIAFYDLYREDARRHNTSTGYGSFWMGYPITPATQSHRVFALLFAAEFYRTTKRVSKRRRI